MQKGALSPERLLVIGGLLVIAFLFLNVNPKNPPGFYRDESAISYNAYTLSTHLKDEYGATMPLFIKSFGDYKSPVYIYLLAAVFRVTGPSTHVARAFSAVLGLAGVLVIYLLAYAISRRRPIALAVTALAGLSPWLFEISRLVFEVAIEPVLIAGFLLVLFRASSGEWRLRHSIGLAVLLALTVYAYQAGRVFAPLFALGLILFYGRRRKREVATVCGLFVLLCVPIVVYGFRHPGALQERLNTNTWIHGSISWWKVPWDYVGHYFSNLNLWNWLVHGDSVQRHHVPGDGSLFWVEVGLAIAGAVIVLVKRRSDPWWRFILFGVVCAPVAAAFTIGSIMTLRMITLPVLLPVLAIPAMQEIAALQPRRLRVAAVSALVVAFAFEAVYWQVDFFRNGPKRLDPFEQQIHSVIQAAFRHGGKVYAYRSFHAAYIDTLWYGAIDGRKPSSIVILNTDAPPPPGSLVVNGTGACPNCKIISTNAGFQAYVTPR